MPVAGPPPRLLVIGLDPYRVPGPWDPAPVADAIERGIARFAENGVGVQTCLLGLDAAMTFPRCSRRLCALIRGSAS